MQPCLQAVIDLVREYNSLGRGALALMMDTKGPGEGRLKGLRLNALGGCADLLAWRGAAALVPAVHPGSQAVCPAARPAAGSAACRGAVG